jgi:hypothetical protein
VSVRATTATAGSGIVLSLAWPASTDGANWRLSFRWRSLAPFLRNADNS